MPINKLAKKIWSNYTENIRTVDFLGAEIYKSAYGDSKSCYGWTIDHIKSKKHGDCNNVNNLQPVHVDTNNQKQDNSSGKIINEYNDHLVVTHFEIHNSNNKDIGKLYIKEQFINYEDKNQSELIIENIYFEDEFAHYHDQYGTTRYSFLDVEESINQNALIFQDGQDPNLWPIKRN